MKNKASDDKLRNSSNHRKLSKANYPPSGRSGGGELMHIDDPIEDGTTQSYINLLK